MHLIDCFINTIIELVDTLESENEESMTNAAELRSNIEKSLAENAYRYKAGGYSEEQYLLAKFSIVAWIDEKVLSQSGLRTQWSHNLMQKEHFGTSNAGQEFFERMGELSPFNPADKDIREVYFYCLCLGFTGKYYRPEDQLALAKIRNDAYQSLATGTGDWEGLEQKGLFPDAIPPVNVGSGVRKERSWAPLYIGLPVIGVLLAFFILRNEIMHRANELVTII